MIGASGRNDPFAAVLGSDRGGGRPEPVGDAALYRITDEDGTVSFYRYPGGPLHRDDGPAVLRGATGTEMWYQDGERHRDGGPALSYAGGPQCWYRHNQRDRADGPAIIYPDGTLFYYRSDRRHRADGPALIRPDGSLQWWLDGRLHRAGGQPAVVLADGSVE
jgi:hypothetical protein